MREPRKEVSQERMWETLAKHAKAQVEVHRKTVGESPKEKLRERVDALDWLEPVKTGKDTGYVLTRCGHFSVAKVVVCGKPMYHAFRVTVIAGKRDYPQIGLGVRLTPEDAKHLCELDNERDPPRDR